VSDVHHCLKSGCSCKKIVLMSSI